MSFTSVTGHLLEADFPPSYSSWESTDVLTLFHAPLVHKVPTDKTDLLHTLQRESRTSDWLILWLDCLSEDMEVLTDRGFMSRAEVFAACPELVPLSPTPAPASDDVLSFGGAIFSREVSPLHWTPSPAEKAKDAADGIRHEMLKSNSTSAELLRDSAHRYGRHCGVCNKRVWSSSQAAAATALSSHVGRHHPAAVAATGAARSGGRISVTTVSAASIISRRASLSTASTATTDPSDAMEVDDVVTPSAAVTPSVTTRPLRPSSTSPLPSSSPSMSATQRSRSGSEGIGVRPPLSRTPSSTTPSTSWSSSAEAAEDVKVDEDGSVIPLPVSRPLLARPASMPLHQTTPPSTYRPLQSSSSSSAPPSPSSSLMRLLDDDDVWPEPRRPLRRLQRMFDCPTRLPDPATPPSTTSASQSPSMSSTQREAIDLTSAADEEDERDEKGETAARTAAPAAASAASSSPLRFASLDPSTGHLVYVPATALAYKTVTSLVQFTHAAEAPHWAADADEYGLTPGQVERMKAQSERARRGEKVAEKFVPEHISNGVSLIVDRRHDMYVRVGSTKSTDVDETHTEWATTDYAKVKAGALLSGDTRQRVKMTAHAPAGLAVAADELPFAALLGLVTAKQVEAFLLVYGYWCGDGSLDSEHRTVGFTAKKDTDKMWLPERLTELGLTVESGAVTAYDCADGSRSVDVKDRRWVDYFFGEYGPKYRVASLASSRPPEKWFWVWVWRLRKEWARFVLAGLRFADGREATDVNCIFTSGVHFRDEIVRLALHAGYSARFHVMYRKGDHRGYDKSGAPIIARHDSWAVCYTDNFLFAEPVLHNHRDIQAVDVPSGATVPVWCVTVPPHNLIIARRVRKNAQGVVTQASRPIVVGQCDREGENISFEVASVCLQARPSLRVLRAHFSALIPADIHHALTTLSPPNRHLSDAVEARIEIDLRIGAAFTRFQSLLLRSACPQVDGVVSYGPCQFPTLGFVVDAWKRRMVFVRERYWQVGMEWGSSGEGGMVRFTWARGRLFDRFICTVLYEAISESDAVRIDRIDSKERRRHRPLPLSTVEMQKRLSSHARLSAAKSMDVAEKLYQRGLISYPRTETDKYKDGTDLRALLVTLSSLPSDCGPYAQRLLTGGFVYPGDGGHDDGAHPPIHPTKADSTLTGDERTVYEFVVRHFLACCSADAIGQETVVTASCRPTKETFTARGLMITQRNYLDVYRYDRWYGNVIPVFTQGQLLTNVRLSLTDGQTNPPPLLTESDLIALMDRHGIGTDATIAQHVETIQKRHYTVVKDRVFIPTALGLGLVEGYDEMGLSLSSPALRAHMEGLMREVGEGRKGKDEVVKEVVDDMRNLLDIIQGRSGVLCRKVEEQLMRGTTPEQQVMQQGLPLRDQPDDAADVAPGNGPGGSGGGGGPPSPGPGIGGDHDASSWDRGGGPDGGADGPPSDDSPPSSPRRRRKEGPAKKGRKKTTTARSRRVRSPPPPPSSRQTGASAGAAGACFHCGQTGHFASACPARARGQPAVGGGGGGQWGGGGGGGQWGAAATGLAVSGDVECYRCKGRGHYANACTNRV